HYHAHHPNLHSFPTRRSSDLQQSLGSDQIGSVNLSIQRTASKSPRSGQRSQSPDPRNTKRTSVRLLGDIPSRISKRKAWGNRNLPLGRAHALQRRRKTPQGRHRTNSQQRWRRVQRIHIKGLYSLLRSASS